MAMLNNQLSKLTAPVIGKIVTNPKRTAGNDARVSLTGMVIKLAEIVIEATDYVIELRKIAIKLNQQATSSSKKNDD